MTTPSTGTYSANGEWQVNTKLPNIYDLTVLAFDPQNNASPFYQHSLVDLYINPNVTGFQEVLKLPAFPIQAGGHYDMHHNNVRSANIIITDNTDYSDPNKQALIAFVQYDKHKQPVPIRFNSSINLVNIYNRTATFEIRAYEGATIFVSTNIRLLAN